MPDLSDIRRGLAAQLRTVLPEGTGHVSPYFQTSPPLPCLLVVGPEGPDAMVKTDFGTGRAWQIGIEAVVSLNNEVAAQVLLDSLIDDVAAAVEADQTPTGALHSRYQDDNTVLASQGAACGSVAFLRYSGVAPFQAGTGPKVMVAKWVVEVQT